MFSRSWRSDRLRGLAFLAVVVGLLGVMQEADGARAEAVTIEGKVLAGHADDFKHQRASYFYTLEVPARAGVRATGKRPQRTRSYSLRFRGKQARRFFKRVRTGRERLAGATVRVRGARVGRRVIVRRARVVRRKRPTAKASAQPLSGAKKVAVLMTNFAEDPNEKPYTAAGVRSALFTDSRSVNAYYKEMSRGDVSLRGKDNVDGDIFGYYTIAPEYGRQCGSNYSAAWEWADLANQAAQADGVDLSSYDYVVYMISDSDCPAPGWTMAIGDHRIFLDAPHYGLEGLAGTASHEFGHAFGQAHANSLRCLDSDGNAVSVTGSLWPLEANKTCENEEYGDPFDVMGASSRYNQFNNIHKARVDLLPGSIQTVTYGDNVYALSPSEPAAAVGALPYTGVQGLRVPARVSKPTGAITEYYYLEYRQPYGVFDNFASTSPVVQGVSIRTRLESRPDIDGWVTHLIDTTPGDGFSVGGEPRNEYTNSALAAGRSFNDPWQNVSFTTLSASASGAQVRVANGPPPGVVEQVYIDGSTLIVNSMVGRANQITVSQSGSSFNITDSSIAGAGSVIDAPGCTRTSTKNVRCTDPSISLVIVNSSDMNDTVTMSTAVDTEVHGGPGNDTLTGSSDSAHKDTLIGDEGDDTLEGRAGPDSLLGYDGTDTASYASASAGVSVNLFEGSSTGAGGEGGDGITGVENLTGSSHNDTLGGIPMSSLRPEKNNVIDGLGGKDTVVCSDYYAVPVTVDLSLTGPQDMAGAGTDTLIQIENAEGSRWGNDTLRGNSGVNVLDGLGGNDEIEGRAGNDTLIGGAGSDMLSYRGSSSGVNISSLADGVRNTGSAGSDSISGFEDLLGSFYADTLVGNSATNLIQGSDGADTIDGGAGFDLVDGGAGNEASISGGGDYDWVVDLGGGNDNFTNLGGADLYYGGAGADTFAGTGSETVLYSDRTAPVAVSFDGIANDGGTLDDNTSLGGQQYDNVGLTVANVISGSGNDTFKGSPTSPNSFAGGAGTDTVDYGQSPAGVTVSIDGAANDGKAGEADNVGADVEKVFGSAFADTLTGNGDSNTFYGLGGIDTLNGAGGSDYLYGGTEKDTLNGGPAGDQLFGEAGPDVLYGNSGDDTYWAGQDSDEDILSEAWGTLVGDGNDTFHVRDAPAVRDRVLDCGPNTVGDTVEADSRDDVHAPSCETINRSNP